MAQAPTQECTPECALAFAREASLGLPGSIKDVADYLLAEGTGIANLTMSEIAARTYVSKPTLVRFAKQAGYTGWTTYRHDFLLAMEQIERERVRQSNVDVNRPFESNTPPSEVAQSIARIHALADQEVERSVRPTSSNGRRTLCSEPTAWRCSPPCRTATESRCSPPA